ncbi:SOS response-associated peptidase (plasmid) [Asticcacaulis sp. DW145]|uniref:SOS response-associated peptidase n=1 Tax=Asticcacaulis sp. DW145 TaxID=3095608 RepID=UPI00308FEFD1|nr:SOS response-associated peptidase [Asticcacaulis sp. DW145]
MCGRFKGPNEKWSELAELLGGFVPSEPTGKPAREVFPTNDYPILRATSARQGYEEIDARWSLIPGWYKGSIKEWKATTFNARVEEAASKPTFRQPWRTKHALVPVAAFYEWSGAHPTDSKKKQRWQITRADNHPMVFAGLWDQCETTDGPVTSFTILTRASGADMVSIHNREPVMLEPDDWASWLDQNETVELEAPAPAGRFRLTMAE